MGGGPSMWRGGSIKSHDGLAGSSSPSRRCTWGGIFLEFGAWSGCDWVRVQYSCHLYLMSVWGDWKIRAWTRTQIMGKHSHKLIRCPVVWEGFFVVTKICGFLEFGKRKCRRLVAAGRDEFCFMRGADIDADILPIPQRGKPGPTHALRLSDIGVARGH